MFKNIMGGFGEKLPKGLKIFKSIKNTQLQKIERASS
jgi:hypothetical protein